MEQKFYISADGGIYTGDLIPGAREATVEEIQQHLNPQAAVEQIQKDLTSAVQAHMDSVAKNKGYDNILSAVTYADEPGVPAFQAEGVVFRAWRSAAWEYCYAQLAAVLKGERETPTAAELIEELPELILPE